MAKLNYAPLEEYLDEQKKKASTSSGAQATSYFQNIAQGTPSQGMAAAQSATREALARQANSMRAQSAQTMASGGQIGQGQAIRGTQAVEQGVLQALADSRNKEAQAIASEQGSANETLLGQSNTDRSASLNALQLGLNSEDAALKASTVRGLKEYLASSGVQMPTDESYLEYNQEAAQKAESDPTAVLERMTAEDALKASQAKQLVASNAGGSRASGIVSAYGISPGEAYNSFIAGLDKPKQQDGDYWNSTVVPLLSKGDQAGAIEAINKYSVARASPSTGSAMKAAKSVSWGVPSVLGGIFS